MVQPPAATPSPQIPIWRSMCTRNLSKPTVSHNVNSTIHISSLGGGGGVISYMMNINAVLEPTTGDLLELRQLLKTLESKLCRDLAFN